MFQTYGIAYIAMLTLFYLSPQSIQSARLSFPSSELAVLLLPPLSPREETPPLAGGGGWGTQFRRRVFYVYCNPTCGKGMLFFKWMRQLWYSTYKTWRGEGREERGVTPLCLSVLADGHLVSGLNWSLGGWWPHCMYYFSMWPTLNKTISSSVIYQQ
jgi:hypothetical protein